MTINSIVQSIKSTFSEFRSPAKAIPSILLICGLAKRPGLSCILSTSNIIESLSKRGIPTEPSPDGSPNLMNLLVHDIVCEVYRALQEDAMVQVSLTPGTATVPTPAGVYTVLGGDGRAQIN